MGRVSYSKDFTRRLRDLQRGNTDSKKAVSAARAAMTEARMDGKISTIPRTKHGESRLPDVEKYDLPDGHRLVVQLVDAEARARVFLFVGTHDEAEIWLDRHRDYRWVQRESDGLLDFIQVADPVPKKQVAVYFPDAPPPDSVLERPLLGVLTEGDWKALKLSVDARPFLEKVTADDWNLDANGIFEQLSRVAGYERACVVLDILAHAHAGEFDQLRSRIALEDGSASLLDPSQAAKELASGQQSENFVTFDDEGLLDEVLEKGNWADWMLFLHPTQKDVATREFDGAARLRGVSGSGKTSVLVHRARNLARRHRAPVLVVTLTESMRKLLDSLLSGLCGVEFANIRTSTVGAIAKDVVAALDPKGLRRFMPMKRDQEQSILGRAVDHVRNEPGFESSVLANMQDLRRFLADEFDYVRSRLLPIEYEIYLDSSAFKRVGRQTKLDVGSRTLVLAGIRYWAEEMARLHVLDALGIVHRALELISEHRKSGVNVRCVLADEVQDLSQLEVLLLSRLTDQTGAPMASLADGLFLAGDGAQTIYRRGFSLRSIGVEITGRSYVMRKNYRNSFEILRSAFPLVRDYDFADHDEDTLGKPMSPDFASRRWERPRLCGYPSVQDEARSTVKLIASLVAMGHEPGQICVVSASPWLRDRIREALANSKIAVAELRDDADVMSDRVKVSTIESSKGHEFESVFIVGAVDGVVPSRDAEDSDMHREASKLYVAMTRARNNLTVSYNKESGARPSRFLASVAPECDEYSFVDGKLRPVQ